MKRIRQTRLHFQEGSSDKVYEAELLQLSETEYLVNFRYGKRGGSLKEGTKTEKAVPFEAAAKVYKSLVVSKMNKGYELESGFDPLEQALNAPVAKANAQNDKRPNSEFILERLRLFSQPSPPITRVSTQNKVGYIQGHSLSRTLWQAIQYNLPECIESVPELIGSEHIPLNYSLVWALGKFGNASHLNALERIKKSLPPSMFYLVDEVREQWLRAESDVSVTGAQTEAILAELNLCRTLQEKLSAYSRYETLRTQALNQNELQKAQNVLNWRGIAEILLPELQAASIEPEWPEFLQALPETLRETLESDFARFADLRQALNDLARDWLHMLKVKALPYCDQDKALYAQIIDKVPLSEITEYGYYQDCLRKGRLEWLYDNEIKRKLGNLINRQRLIPVDYPMIDAHDLIKRLESYTKYDQAETKPISDAQRQAAWQILERYQCHESVRSAMEQKPMKIDPNFIQTQAWQFPEKMLPPQGLSQYQGILKATVEKLFYAYRAQKREALMKNRASERLAFEEQVLRLSRQTQSQPQLRKAFLDLFTHLPLSKDTFPLMRKCLKLAEFRSDHEWLALLYHRLESNPAISGNFGYYGRDGQHPLTPATRNYFRRRSVRLLKTVAQHQPQDYVSLAVAFLKQIQDGVDCFEAKSEILSRYFETDEGYQRRTRKREFPAFSSHLALGYILWQGSRLYQLDKKALKWLKSESFKSDVDRPEAHAALWDQAPELVLELLLSAQAEIVNDFALARLRSQPQFCEGLDLSTCLALLQCPYQNTALFAADLLIDKIAEPDVLKAFLDSRFEPVRALALEQLSSAYLLGQQRLLVHLLCSPYPDIQDRLRSFETLFAALEPTFADEFVDYLLSQATDTGLDLSLLQASVTGFLRDSLRARVSLSTLEKLLASPLLFFQTLAVELLEASTFTYADLAHFPALMQASAYPFVQAGAIRLLAKLPMGVQIGQLPSLVSALWHEDLAYRQASAQILKGLATQATPSDYPAEIWQALYPAFFKSCSEELRFELLELLEAFTAIFPLLDSGQVWALLTARAKLAQQVGGRVISAQNGREYGLEQLIRLSKHACLSARMWALEALENDPRSVENLNLLVEVLDNPWDDARKKALHFFQGLEANLWTPERVIAVCDQVYGDVQAFGQALVSAFFQAGQGPVYLQALSQHPSRSIQLFVSGFLESELAPQPDQILALEPFFRGVLLQVNQGRVLKDRVLRFLSQAALEHEERPEVAEMVFQLLSQQALTTVQNDRAQVILALHRLQLKFPDRVTPLQVIAPRKVAH
ncbi:MAG: hypothetical protein AB7I41_21840 [Candidatus Sericytochromatia bacterium]